MGAEAFENVMPHHAGIKALWETKWKMPCSRAVYPFHDGALEDFEPIFADLIARGAGDGGTSPEYTRAFFAAAESLEKRGDEALGAKTSTTLEKKEKEKEASALYLRAACVLRIARFPYVASFPRVTDPVKLDAWERQKRVYKKAARTWDAPVEEVDIPHVYRQGGDGGSIPAYLRVPTGKPNGAATAANGNGYGHRNGNASNGGHDKKHPAVILLTGLDGYRPDNTTRCDEFLARGWAAVVVEIPGTADCPADPTDPASGDRVLDSVLAWMASPTRGGSDPGGFAFDMDRLMVWGLSAGGYHAVRAAHMHHSRLRGVVAQGAGVHHFYDRDWLARADGHEYPFDLAPAMAAKHGFDSAAEYREEVQAKFSLLELGVIKGPSTRLLLINVCLLVLSISSPSASPVQSIVIMISSCCVRLAY